MKLLVLISLFIFSLSATAEDTTTASESTLPLKKFDDSTVKPKNDIDKEIDHGYIRAKSGSKRRWSGSVDFTFRGGSIDKPFAETRPSLYDNSTFEARTGISGDISGRYRATKNDSFSLGTGMSLMTPFHGDTDPDKSQFDVNNPFVGYSRVYRWRFLQNITSITVNHATSEAADQFDFRGGLTVSQNALTRFGSWTVGAVIGATYSKYGSDIKSRYLSRANQLEYMVMASPYGEYKISNKWSARGFLSVMNFTHNRVRTDRTPFNMEKSRNWATLGLSYNLARDIYLYPNILFNPTDLEDKKSHVGLSATINL